MLAKKEPISPLCISNFSNYRVREKNADFPCLPVLRTTFKNFINFYVLPFFIATASGSNRTTDTQAFSGDMIFGSHKTENHQEAHLSLDTQRLNNEVRSSTTIRRAVRSLVEPLKNRRNMRAKSTLKYFLRILQNVNLLLNFG